jgi:peptidoglycan hydrolase CwlO-like protein
MSPDLTKPRPRSFFSRVSAGLVFLLAFGLFTTSFQSTLAAPETNATSTPADAPAQTGPSVADQRKDLEGQLADLEKQIDDNQKTIDSYQKQGKTLNGEIGTLNARINKLNLQIKAVNLNLANLSQDINDTQKNINQTENNIDLHRDAISKALQTLYEADQQSTIEILLANNKLSDFFGDMNNITLVQDNLRVALSEITKLRQQLVEDKDQLTAQKEDAENLRAVQQSQKKTVETTKTQKSTLLVQTKGKESEYQKLLAKNKATAAQIRSRIFELLGGGELTFEKAYQYAKLAEGATGVRAALVLAILNQESLLGKNVGRCSYTTAMNPTRDKPIFLDLLKQLNIDPSSEFAKVSCPILAHGSYGGAMGPAQFIPSTWKLYEPKITAVTGNNPPNPWNNSDAFAATAVYIRDLLDSSGCKSYADTNKNALPYQTLIERCAASKYYAGGNWYKYRFYYGDPVADKADQFQKDIDTLNLVITPKENKES